MRTICTLLDLNSIKYDHFDVNIFQEEIKALKGKKGMIDDGKPAEEAPLPASPCGFASPVLVENKQTIFGDAPTLYKYLCMTKRPAQINPTMSIKEFEMKEAFYPRDKINADRKKTMDCFLEYIELMVRRNSSRITKLVTQNLHY